MIAILHALQDRTDLPPHENLIASAPAGPLTTDTLDSRVRRLEHVLAMRPRDVDTPNAHDGEAALKQFSMVLRSLQQFTDEVRTRIGADAWDAGDVLAARLLLEDLTTALRNCRVVSHDTTSRLFNVDRAVRAGHNFLRREPVGRHET
jgi:hypothetical protein